MIEVPLRGDQGRETAALISALDYPRVKNLKWYLTSGYAATRLSNTTVYMHRLILRAPAGYVVDHINHDPLDNRRENLRVTNQSHNMANARPTTGKSSKYKGVFWDPRRQYWRASIKQNGKNHYLGAYAEEEEAAKAYDSAALTLFGEFAYPNFPHSQAKPLQLISIEARSRSAPQALQRISRSIQTP